MAKVNENLVQAFGRLDRSHKETWRQHVAKLKDHMPPFDEESYHKQQYELARKEWNRRCESQRNLKKCCLHFSEEIQLDDGSREISDFRQDAGSMNGSSAATVIREFDGREKEMKNKKLMWVNFFDNNIGRDAYGPFLPGIDLPDA